MYEQYWQLNSAPFLSGAAAQSTAGPVAQFFRSRSHQAALLKLKFMTQHRPGLAVLAGATGQGKSDLLEVLQQELAGEPIEFISLVFPQLSPIELVALVASRLHVGAYEAQRYPAFDSVLRQLDDRFRELARRQRDVVLLIDDAQLIADRRIMETLHQLLNLAASAHLGFSLVLSGQLELLGQLSRYPALDERCLFKALLQPLTLSETAQYVRHRLSIAGSTREIFSPEALRSVFEQTQGNPRRINRLCDYALLVGYSDDLYQLEPGHIQAVAQELLVPSAA